jgi:hypothetical protein
MNKHKGIKNKGLEALYELSESVQQYCKETGIDMAGDFLKDKAEKQDEKDKLYYEKEN